MLIVLHGYLLQNMDVSYYLKKEKEPLGEWILRVSAAGVGYALLTKEAYPGEHDELIESMEAVDNFPKVVENFTTFLQDIYKNQNESYAAAMGFWAGLEKTYTLVLYPAVVIFIGAFAKLSQYAVDG